MGISHQDAELKFHADLISLRNGSHYSTAPPDEQALLLACISVTQARLTVRGMDVDRLTPRDAFFANVTESSTGDSSSTSFLLGIIDRVLVDKTQLPASASDRALRVAVKSELVRLHPGASETKVRDIATRLILLRMDPRFAGVSYKTRVRFEFGFRLLNVLEAKQGSGGIDPITLEKLIEIWDALLPT
jgi:hypothetical protein